MSTGEIIRRSVEGYRPNEEEVLLTALADELKRSVRDARKALSAAQAEIRQTLEHFAAHRRLADKPA